MDSSNQAQKQTARRSVERIFPIAGRLRTYQKEWLRPDVIAGLTVLLDVGASADFDVSTTDMLGDLITKLGDTNIRILLSHAKGSIRSALRRTHLTEKIGEEHVYLSTQLAVHGFLLGEQIREEAAVRRDLGVEEALAQEVSC